MKMFLKDNRLRIIKTIKIILSIGMIVIFFVYVPVNEIYKSVQSVNPKLFWVSFLIGFPILYLEAIKLWVFARKQGIIISVHQVFIINLTVKIYSFLSPASIVGSGIKWYKLSSPGKKAEALSAIAIGRVWDISTAIFFGLLWMIFGFGSNIISFVFLSLILAILIMGWFAVLMVSPILSKWAKAREISTEKKTKTLFSSIYKLFNAISTYKNFSLKELFVLFSGSITKDLVSIIGYTLLARALHISISFLDLGWMRSIFFLSGLVPLKMVGGIGLREVSAVMVMSAIGISSELAVAFSFLIYARSLMLSLVGGVVELFSLFQNKN